MRRPFAFETGVNYLGTRPGELRDGVWWRTIAETSDCGIVLDLHNVWCNARNGRQQLDSLFDDLPLERVWELHVAGGEQVDGMWLDSHSGLVDSDLLEIASALVPRLPALRAITFEIVPEYLIDRQITRAEIRDMLGTLHRLWDLRQPEEITVDVPTVIVDDPDDVDAIAAAEVALARSVVERDRAEPEEPGLVVMRNLIEAIRRGLSVTVLPLTLRLLRLELGRDAIEEAFETCWRQTTPELIADAEARHLATALRSRFGHLPHLVEVLDYELALVELEPHRRLRSRANRPRYSPRWDGANDHKSSTSAHTSSSWRDDQRLINRWVLT